MFTFFLSEESVVTRTLISLHRHVSLSLVRNVALLNRTLVCTQKQVTLWFQYEPSNKGGNDKQVMI